MGGKMCCSKEREGFNQLADCYRDGTGCDQDAERAKENFLVAAELGHVIAMGGLGEFLDKDDPQRYVWFGRAAANADFIPFLSGMSEQHATSIPELDMQRSFLQSDEL
jgi:TPR repeat protein